MLTPAASGRTFAAFSIAALAFGGAFAGYALWHAQIDLLNGVTALPAWRDGGAVEGLSVAGLLSLCLLVGVGGYRRWRRTGLAKGAVQALFVEHTPDAMLLVDAGLCVIAVNPACERLLGVPGSKLVGRPLGSLGVAGAGVEALLAADRALTCTGEVRGRCAAGRPFVRQLAGQRLQADGAAWMLCLSDLTTEKAQAARIDYLAHHDPLTGLPNRVALGGFFDSAIAAARRNGGLLGVLVLDLDNFKTLNDSLGHQAGDRLLVEVARRVLRCAGDFDHVIRLGGDEFVVLVEGVPNREMLQTQVDVLLRAIGEVCVIDGHALHVSASVGISLFPDDGDSPEALMRNADTAMYCAKANGRSRYRFFEAPMNTAANKRLQLESELWDALSDNQLVLHYQPQIDLPSGGMVGVEALVRWQHPKRGLIPPADFISLAEESGLILPIGHWVLVSACRQARRWLDEGVDIGEMAVNISPHQFRQPGFAASVREVLAETGLPAERLELEITETTVMHGADASVATLSELKAMGVRLAIDDFGTGYSSLSYLRRFPVDHLKIDRSFVADLESDAEAASLITSIIALGQSLGLRLVAEGVENSAQADFLRGMACERVQGYHFSQPMLPEQIVVMHNLLRSAAVPRPHRASDGAAHCDDA